jgi:hypothetical protein
MTLLDLLHDKFFIEAMLILILPFAGMVFLAMKVKHSTLPWDKEKKQLGVYGMTDAEYKSSHPGEFGPNTKAKIGLGTFFGLLLVALNYLTITAPYPFKWPGQVLFNLFWVAIFYFGILPQNVYVRDDELTFGKFFKHTVPVRNILSAKRLTEYGQYGIPHYVLALERVSEKAIKIRGWDILSIAELIKELKNKNPTIEVSEDYTQLVAASTEEEMKAAKKAYGAQEWKETLRAGAVGLITLAVIYGIWFLIKLAINKG